MSARPGGFPPGWLASIALLLSLGLFLAMIWGPLAELREIAGGLAHFDLRPRGYDFDDARTSAFTIAKSAASALTEAAVLALLVAAFRRWLLRRRRGA